MAAEEEQESSPWLDDTDRCEHMLLRPIRRSQCPFKNNDTESCQWCRKPPYEYRNYWDDERGRYVRYRYRIVNQRTKDLPEASDTSGSDTDGERVTDWITQLGYPHFSYEEQRELLFDMVDYFPEGRRHTHYSPGLPPPVSRHVRSLNDDDW